jgi:hypothetical protein
MRGPFLKIASTRALRATDAAVLVHIEDHGDVWIPQSQIHDDSEVSKPGDEGDLIITQWIAEQKGIEDEGSEYEP